jgi:hypothetical protein
VTSDRKAALEQLRSEIATLALLPPLSPEFAEWLGRLLKVVEAGFGSHSEELRQLRAISPELPSEFFDSIQNRLPALGLNDKLRSELLKKLIKDTPEEMFRKRLYEYDDFIASILPR